MRILDGRTVDRYLDVALSLEAMRRCFTLESRGLTGPVSRTDLNHAGGWMRVLPAVFEGLGVFGHKVISFNKTGGVRYVVTVFDIASGEMLAVVDADAITGARTGATAAVAAEFLCPPEIEVATIIGTGSVAKSQIPMMQAVRPARQIRVFSRNMANRAAFITQMSRIVDAEWIDCSSAEEAIEGAQLVTLATKSTDPSIFAQQLRPGMHVNSVGSARPPLFEVAPEAFAVFDRVVCDSVDLVFSESGDAIAAARDAGFDTTNALDLATILSNPVDRAADEITLFKSSGTGLQDLALTVAVLQRAEADGAGTVVDGVLTVKTPLS